MAEADIEKSSYGMMERIIGIIVIPVLFTVILTVVLLSLFGFDVSRSILETANQIPLLNRVIPDPKPDDALLADDAADSAAQPAPKAEDLQELRQQIESLTLEKEAGEEQLKQREEEIRQLREQIQTMQDRDERASITEEEYEAQIAQVAKIYSDMSASKAAPIMENMTLSERVLLLSKMKTSAQVAILEKMNPQTAATTSVALKDIQTVEDIRISALQERLETQEPQESEAFTLEELGRTFAAMDARSAAQLLLEMAKTNEGRVVSVLKKMELQPRSAVLAQMSGLSESDAARISGKLSSE
ncbi:hypothetical protein XYCOK13_14660 [Xylanibacillus composti]|uniref:Flagellar motility protein MotE (MotC chaperone) n=1 Tax=Xylanibacillus composti TaxID=1572762 RepID=A0A8J4H0G5_9BACL|nr:hypothetical protein [Xylanibacillus composti]GIQ68642.1 hypothetical protein XYCOK13_14660 [Xylanibacillus composti]